MKTYAQQQAQQLLETDQCQLPVDWNTIAHRIASHEHFAQAIRRAHRGDSLTLHMITEIAALELCREQDRDA